MSRAAKWPHTHNNNSSINAPIKAVSQSFTIKSRTLTRRFAAAGHLFEPRPHPKVLGIFFFTTKKKKKNECKCNVISSSLTALPSFQFDDHLIGDGTFKRVVIIVWSSQVKTDVVVVFSSPFFLCTSLLFLFSTTNRHASTLQFCVCVCFLNDRRFLNDGRHATAGPHSSPSSDSTQHETNRLVGGNISSLVVVGTPSSFKGKERNVFK